MPLDEMKILKRENRELKKYLSSLTKVIADCIGALDAEMNRPSDNERGKRIAVISNMLEYANDSTVHFGIGLSFEQMKRIKRRLPSANTR